MPGRRICPATFQNSRGSQSNAIERRFLIESIEPNRTQSFDWFSIVFGNRTPIELLHLFYDWFDWFDVRLHSITVRLRLITIQLIRFSIFFLYGFAFFLCPDPNGYWYILWLTHPYNNILHTKTFPTWAACRRRTEGFYHETSADRSTKTHRVVFVSI